MHVQRLRSAIERRHLRAALRSFYSTNSCIPGQSTDHRASSPPPIRVSLTESAGRGVFATRKIGAGDLIHTAKPVVAHPSLSLLHKVCSYCLKRLGTEGNITLPYAKSTTSVNMKVQFCSEGCKENSKDYYEVEMLADWSAYNDHCRYRGLKYPLLLKRLACMVISGAVSADYLDILQPERLSAEMISEMEAEFNLLRSTFIKSGIDAEQIAFLTKQWYSSVIARVRINAFPVELIDVLHEDLLCSAAASVEAEAAVGNAVYMLPSFYNHDCDPNTHIIWIDSANSRLKALRDIEEGEELRICYIDASIDHDARQALLLKGFGFQCRCLRCISGD